MTENPGNLPPQYGGNDNAPQQAQNPQGGAPQYGYAGQAPADPGPAPATVRKGVLMIYIALAITFVAGLVSNIMQENYGSIPGTFIGAALGVLFVWFASKGKNWARIVVLVLAILGVLLALFGVLGVAALSALDPSDLQGTEVDVQDVLGILWVTIGIGFVCNVLYLIGAIFLWLRPSSAWYNARKFTQYR